MSKPAVDAPTIREITAAWLKENGFDGLVNPETECGCHFGDFMICGGGLDQVDCNECRAAHKELQANGDWLMFPGKAKEIDP